LKREFDENFNVFVVSVSGLFVPVVVLLLSGDCDALDVAEFTAFIGNFVFQLVVDAGGVDHVLEHHHSTLHHAARNSLTL